MMILYEVKFQKAKALHKLLLSPDGRKVEYKDAIDETKGNEKDKDD